MPEFANPHLIKFPKLGDFDDIIIKEFGEEIACLTSVEFKPIYQALPENDPMKRRLDITNAKEILGWEPKEDRAEGLRRRLEYFKEYVQ